MKVSLHVGAHKTASTFMQEALAKAAPALGERGVGFVDTELFRQEVTRQVCRPHPGGMMAAARRASKARKFLKRSLSVRGIERMILSDENIIGTPLEMVRDARLYPGAGDRLERLAPLLEGHEVTVFLAVRAYAEFSRSLYCEYVRAPGDEFHDVDKFREGWLANGPCWTDLAETILARFPQSQLVVWRYEDFRTHPQRIMNFLPVLDSPYRFDLEKLYRRRSLSHAATEALMRIGAEQGAAAMDAQAHDVAKAYPANPKDRRYRLWNRRQRLAFDALMDKDLARIAALERTTLVDLR